MQRKHPAFQEISDLLAPERSLAGLTAGLLVEFRPRWPRSSPKLRQKVLTISLKLWKQETCKATAIRLLEWFKVTEADVSNTTQRLALGAVCGELQTNGSDGEHLVLMLTRFPEIARGSGVTAERVIDGMAQRGYLKPAILVAERMNVTNKIRQLKGRLMDACVKGEGKAGVLCSEVCRVQRCSECGLNGAPLPRTVLGVQPPRRNANESVCEHREKAKAKSTAFKLANIDV